MASQDNLREEILKHLEAYNRDRQTNPAMADIEWKTYVDKLVRTSNPAVTAGIAINLRGDNAQFEQAFNDVQNELAQQQTRSVDIKKRWLSFIKRKNEKDEAVIAKEEALEAKAAQAEAQREEAEEEEIAQEEQETALAKEHVKEKLAEYTDEGERVTPAAPARTASAPISRGKLRAAGAAVASGGASIGRSMLSATQGARRPVQKFLDGDFDVDKAWWWILLIVAIAGHVWLIVNGIGLSSPVPPYFTTGVLVYFLGVAVMLSLIFLFAQNKQEELKVAGMISIIAMIVYLAPGWLSNASPTVNTIATQLCAFLPVWVFYIAFRLGGWVSALAKIAIVALAFFMLMLPLFLQSSALLPHTIGTKVQVLPAIDAFWTKLSSDAEKGLTNVKQTFFGITDPGSYYTGTVEQNNKKPLGVSVDNLRPIDPIVTSDSDIIISGAISGKSFVADTIPISPSCTLETKNAPAAIVDPTKMDLIPGTTQGFECRFISPQLKPGTYTVKAGATFPFETWAYITYTFVDEEQALALARQSKNINTVLGIAQEPTAIYTNGPITVGMGGASQPLLVRPDKDPILSTGSRIGITVDSAWQNGKLQHVDKLEIKVPEPFTLSNCDRNLSQDPSPDEKAEGYTDYVFTNPRFDPVLTYTSITCRLNIDQGKKDQALNLVTTGDKAERSFIAVVKYQYTIQSQTSVQVK